MEHKRFDRRFAFLWAALVALVSVGIGPTRAQADHVTLLRTPDGGIQPQAVLDSKDVLHLIYFRGDPDHGDIFYVHKALGQDSQFSVPVRVNSHPGSAIATGTIRGAQIALGRTGRISVVWNAVGQKTKGGYSRLGMAYTRLNATGTAFEPQRDLLPSQDCLDGGGSVAADAAGNVYVTWHTSTAGKDEAAGGVYLTRSQDDGRTFTPPHRISLGATGQCGCCAMRAFVDHRGTLYILYRAAGANIHRDTTLLVSRDHGATFQSRVVQPWQINACPMSNFSLAESEAGVLGAWETAGQVSYARLSGAEATRPTPAPETGSRKYPVVVPGTDGTTLLAWVDGAGWDHGGSLHWQVFDKRNVPTADKGQVTGVPTWSLVTAVTGPDGSFLLIY